jgi:hypothetical protein
MGTRSLQEEEEEEEEEYMVPLVAEPFLLVLGADG